ncbi:MAG: cysteine-rich CWC family protein [Pyrinomonadaceae bacterium]
MVMKKKLLETEIAEAVSKKMICESCGKEFSCGANLGECWCFNIELKTETLTELRDNFENCLCENCLWQKRKANF